MLGIIGSCWARHFVKLCIWSARLFVYQHVGINNVKRRGGGYCPTQSEEVCVTVEYRYRHCWFNYLAVVVSEIYAKITRISLGMDRINAVICRNVLSHLSVTIYFYFHLHYKWEFCGSDL